MKFIVHLLSFIFGIIIITTLILVTIAFTVDFDEDFQLSIIHINDFHARFEETNNASLPCQNNQVCIGGYSRMSTVVKQLQRNRVNSIFLNAADYFQGTVWYSIFRYNVTSHFLNLLPADALTIGNHEFAHNIDGLVPLLKEITSPVVVANIDDAEEPTIQNLYKKSIIINVGGRKIGIVGAIYSKTSEIAVTGRLKFTDEVKAIRKQSIELLNQGANIIIALTHCGLNIDIKIAEEVGDLVDIVVGGHSHTFLYSPNDANYPGFDTIPTGPYPIEVTPKNSIKRKVLVVQAFAFARYVGDLQVTFDSEGNVKSFQGNPIFLGPNVEKDPEMELELNVWREKLKKMTHRSIGHTNVDLNNNLCWQQECAIGSFTTDGVVHESRLAFPQFDVKSAIIQASGMRSSFVKGPITFGDVLTFLPFGNTFDLLELNGTTLKDVFEHSVSRSWREDEFIGPHMLQISGIQVTFNTSRAVGSRVDILRIKNHDNEFEDVVDAKYYKLAIASFLVAGGDGYTMIRDNKRNFQPGLFDLEVMEAHINRMSPINYETNNVEFMLMLIWN